MLDEASPDQEASEGTLCPVARRKRSGGRTDRRTAHGLVMAVVFDTSALMACLSEEPGAEIVQTTLSAGVHVDGMQEDLQALGMRGGNLLAGGWREGYATAGLVAGRPGLPEPGHSCR